MEMSSKRSLFDIYPHYNIPQLMVWSWVAFEDSTENKNAKVQQVDGVYNRYDTWES